MTADNPCFDCDGECRGPDCEHFDDFDDEPDYRGYGPIRRAPRWS